MGKLLLVVDPMAFATTYAYDRLGNLLSVTDGQRRNTHYIYDAANRLVEEKRPDGVSVFTQYDLAGRMIATINGRNQKIVYRYDNRNRLVESTYPSGGNVRYDYDAVGRRTSMTDSNGTTRYRYNLLGWLEETTDPLGNAVSYAYNPTGNRTRMDLNSASFDFTGTYKYDDAGRLNSLQSPGVARANTVAYEQAGRLTKLSYANNDIVSQGCDQAGALTSIKSSGTAGTIQQLTYNLNRAGRRTNVDRAGSAVVDGDIFYKYDANSRVATAGPNSAASNREYTTTWSATGTPWWSIPGIPRASQRTCTTR